MQLKQVNSVSCVFFGDGAVEEGAFYESVNFAILKNLPVLFICENNLYSVYSPLNVRQPERRKIHKMVKAFGKSVVGVFFTISLNSLLSLFILLLLEFRQL